MKAKSVLTVVLLVFVAASVGMLVLKQARQSPQPTQPSGPTPLVSDPSPQDEEGSPAAGKWVLAYYFHGKTRCPTCRDIEAYAHEAVETGFPEELKDGRLRWEIINYDEAGKEHYALQYEVVAPSLVLVMMDGNREIKWENLAEVWELVGDKPAFVDFVQEQVQAFLEECGESA